MIRQAGGYSSNEQLETLYENMHPRYKMHIPQNSITRPGELFKRAEKIEQLEIQCRERQKVVKPAPAAAVAYERRECCWSCKQRGHTRFECKRILRKFCSRCGKDGVLMKECHRKTTSGKGRSRLGPPVALQAATPPNRIRPKSAVRGSPRHQHRGVICK